MSNKTGIGYGPLTQKVYWGKQNEEKGMWVGEKRDITHDFLSVLLDEYLPENTSRDIVGDKGSKNIIINCKDNKESLEAWIKKLQKRLEKL